MYSVSDLNAPSYSLSNSNVSDSVEIHLLLSRNLLLKGSPLTNQPSRLRIIWQACFSPKVLIVAFRYLFMVSKRRERSISGTASPSSRALICLKIHGFPTAALPIMTKSHPVSDSIRKVFQNHNALINIRRVDGNF